MKTLILVASLVSAASAFADATKLPEILVTGRETSLLGVSESATAGTTGAVDLSLRPISRSGEVLETVPGMIITQHSGGGKANQYYLRGFNLDHGTNFATFVDGVPINLPTHAHGQGYSDINWVIPEMLKNVHYEKGVYSAEQGDFANAGSANMQYFDRLPRSWNELQLGSFGFYRALAAASPKVGSGNLLYALDYEHADGPWTPAQNYRKATGFLKYSEGEKSNGFSVTAQAYDGRWFGSDQVPERAILSGAVDKYGSLDPTSGGKSRRSSLYGEWHRQDDSSASEILAYTTHYDLDLFSNFTYAIDQTNGDQLHQEDSRTYFGVRAQHSLYGKLFDRETENTFGLQVRDDNINAALGQTRERALVKHYRSDAVNELNIAPWYRNKLQWASWFRSVAGLRADFYSIKDEADNVVNSGSSTAAALSPKLTLAFGPWAKSEVFLQGGLGLRTNDARAPLTTVNPIDGTASRQLPLITRTRGAEVGVRSEVVETLNSTLSVWSLWSDSETVFDGDSGAVVDSERPGVRYGVEWANYCRPVHWLSFDLDLGTSTARFTDDDAKGLGKYIPDSVTTVASGGVQIRELESLPGFSAGLRLRAFGPRPLNEDNSQTSAPSVVFNLVSGYEISSAWLVSVDVLNLFDTKYNDAEYYYSSRLRGEAAGPEADGGTSDHMVHAGDPRSFRVSLVGRF